MSPPLRVAVIGVGFGQQVHVPAFRADSRCEVTTLCASDEAKAAEIATRLNVPHASGNWRAVAADPKIDLVSIAVPPRLQPQIALAALERGKAVFCEKPLGVHLHDVLPLRRANTPSPTLSPVPRETGSSSARRAIGMVNFELCECDAWQEFQQSARCQPSRPTTSVEIDWRVQTYSNKRRIDNWKSRPDEGGGALQGFAAHSFYLLEQLYGPICRLQAQLTQGADDPRTGETAVDLEFEYLLGGRGSVHIATDSPPPHRHQIDLIEPGRILRLLNEGSDYIRGFELFSGFGRASDPLKRVFPEDEPLPVPRSAAGETGAAAPDGRIEATSRLVRKFVDGALGGSPAHPNLCDGYRVQYLIEAARRSNAEGRWIGTSE
jgi:predicted dehydrogenase